MLSALTSRNISVQPRRLASATSADSSRVPMPCPHRLAATAIVSTSAWPPAASRPA